MPIYEYRCDTCNTVIEKRQRFSDPPLTNCEVCSGPLKKLISAPGLQFKGSGWYVTDYAGKGKNGGGNGADKGTAEAADGETKPETKRAAEKTAHASKSETPASKSDSSSK